ncbi:MAG: pyridoxamine 5'-phosphate oxidase family protein [Selenomonadaceae bacterium]
METIRYQQRVCQDEEKIQHFLTKMRVGTLAMISNGRPYAVPLNYVWNGTALYFHGLASGKKTEALQENPWCCFTVFREYGTVMDDMPCAADTSYLSIVLFGQTMLVEDNEEKTMILQKIVDKYMPEYYKKPLTEKLVKNYRSSHDQRGVQVYKIVPESMTAKENKAAAEELFPAGTNTDKV